MTVSELTKIDFLLKDGGIGMVEHRDPAESIWSLKKVQALMKGQLALQFLNSDQAPEKYSSVYLFWIGERPSSDMVDFLKRHHFGVKDFKFGDQSKESKTLVPNKPQKREDIKLAIDGKEINALMKDCGDYFVRERKKENIVLDYSLDSLKKLDAWLIANRERFKGNLSGNDAIVLAGAYLGEAMIKEYGGNWEFGPGLGQYSIFVNIHGNKGNCIGKVNKLVDGGDGDETYGFARVLKQYLSGGK